MVTKLTQIQKLIYEIRGQKVVLDSDLALLYEVETFNLNKAVKRNIERFPGDFMFQITKEEWENLIFQNGISRNQQPRQPLHPQTSAAAFFRLASPAMARASPDSASLRQMAQLPASSSKLGSNDSMVRGPS